MASSAAPVKLVLTMKFARTLHGVIGEGDLHAGLEHECCAEKKKVNSKCEPYLCVLTHP